MSHVEAVLYVENLQVVADFHERALGLQRGEAGEDFCELSAGDFRLWLVRGQGVVSRDSAGMPRRRSEVPAKLCFEVASIAAVRNEIGDGHGRSAGGTWSFGGYLRADLVDPEGNVVQLLEATGPEPRYK